MSVDQPFNPPRARGLRPDEAVAGLGANRHRAAFDHVQPERMRVIRSDGDEVAYDMLVLGPRRPPRAGMAVSELLTYHGGRDRPDRASWPLPLYDLA